MSRAPGPARSFGHGTVSRDAAWSLAYTGVLRLATFGVSIAVARLAGPASAGAFGVALQVSGLAGLLATFNLPAGLAKHLAESEDAARRRAFLSTSGLLVLGLGTVVGATLALLAGPLGAMVYRDPSLGPVLFWCGPLVLAMACCAWVEGALQGMRRFDTLTRWGSVLSALDLVAGACSAVWGVVGVVVSRAMVRALGAATAFARWLAPGAGRERGVPGGTALPFAAFTESAGTLLGFAGPTLLSGGIVLAGHALLRLLLVRDAGLGAAGQYQAAESLAQGLTLVPSAAAAAFMRAVSSGRDAGYADLPGALQRGLERILGFHLGPCLVLIGVVPWATQAVFGHEFASAQPVLVLLAVAYGLFGPCVLFGAAMLGRGEVWTGVAVNSGWAAVIQVVYAVVTRPLGSSGAALAVAAGYLVLLLVSVALVAPRWGVPARSLLPATAVTIASLTIAGGLALAPGVPRLLTAVVCLALGLALFLRWGLSALVDRDRGEMP